MEATIQQYFDRYGGICRTNPRPLYGSAKLSVAEIGWYRREVEALIAEGDTKREAIAKLREDLETDREMTLPKEDLRHVFMQCALLHGCSVAGTIDTEVKEGTKNRTYEDTIWSYTTKNRAYRFVETCLIRNDRDDLLADWQGEFEKQDDEIGQLEETLTRPSTLHRREQGNPIITGIEKPACYYPCHLLRVIEALRLGKEVIVETEDPNGKIKSDIKPIGLAQSSAEKGNVSDFEYINDLDPQLFILYWEGLEETIIKSTCLQDIAVNIATKVAYELKTTSMLNDETIALILLKGYSPTGPIKEHGLTTEVSSIWKKLLTTLRGTDPQLFKKLKEKLLATLQRTDTQLYEKFKELYQ